jgi:sugar phosphate permease
MAVLLYLDRFSLSFIERFIREELTLTKDEIGLLLGALLATYALAQVPTGWLSDRYGARKMLTIYILLWSLFTGLIGVGHTFLFILLMRLGCGVAQAGAYPTSAGLLAQWVPFPSRGWASGIVSTGGRVGGFAAPLLTAYLMVMFVPIDGSSLPTDDDVIDVRGLVKSINESDNPALWPIVCELRGSMQFHRADRISEAETLTAALQEFCAGRDQYRHINLSDFSLPNEALRLAEIPSDQVTDWQVQRRNRLLLEAAFPNHIKKIYGPSWRNVMAIYGFAGLAVGLFFWLYVRDRPQEHPGCNAAELALIGSGAKKGTQGLATSVRIPWRAIMASRSLWLSSLAQFGTGFGWVFLLTLLPRYLDEVHHVPVIERGWMASLPVLVGMVGMLGGGWLTDYLTRRMGLRWGRCLPLALTRFVAMSAFLVCLGLDSPWPATVAFCVVAISTDLGTPAVWAFMQDTGGRHVGSILGWGNMWGNLGSALSPVVVTWLVDPEKGGSWNAGFLACAAAFLIAGVASLGIDASIPIAPQNED